jgi:hypothetical protein
LSSSVMAPRNIGARSNRLVKMLPKKLTFHTPRA